MFGSSRSPHQLRRIRLCRNGGARAGLPLAAEILDHGFGFLDLFRKHFDVYRVASPTFADESTVLDHAFKSLVGLLTAGRAPQWDRREVCAAQNVMPRLGPDSRRRSAAARSAPSGSMSTSAASSRLAG